MQSIKYSIHINQKLLLELAPDLDIKHYAIVDYLKAICISQSDKIANQRVTDENGDTWTWVNLTHATKQMPCLKIKSTGTMSDRIKEICKVQKMTPDGDRHQLFHKARKKGNKLYIRPGKLLTLAEFAQANAGIRENERRNSFKRTNNNTSDYKTIDNNSAEKPIEKEKTTPISEHFFAEFWKLYPKKVSKKKAKKIYQRAVRGDPDLLDTIDEALQEYIKTEQWQRDGGRYIPHPTTWLRNERWNDKLETEVEDDTRGYQLKQYSK